MKGIASCHPRDQCVVSVLFKILEGELEGEEKNERKVKGGINAINLEEQRREREMLRSCIGTAIGLCRSDVIESILLFWRQTLQIEQFLPRFPNVIPLIRSLCVLYRTVLWTQRTVHVHREEGSFLLVILPTSWEILILLHSPQSFLRNYLLTRWSQV